MNLCIILGKEKIMEQSIRFSKVLKDYFKEYKRGFNFARLILILLIAVGPIVVNENRFGLNYVLGIPVLFATISGAFHIVSLPVMMYFIPATKKMREIYIQRMLEIKIMVPMMVAVFVDLILICFGKAYIKAVILQIMAVFFITFIMGTLNDGTYFPDEFKLAQEGMRYFSASILMGCYVFSGAIIQIVCSEEILLSEFLTVLGVCVAVLGTISLCICKYWHSIKANYADYEMTTKVEVQNRRW